MCEMVLDISILVDFCPTEVLSPGKSQCLQPMSLFLYPYRKSFCQNISLSVCASPRCNSRSGRILMSELIEYGIVEIALEELKACSQLSRIQQQSAEENVALCVFVCCGRVKQVFI